MLRARCGQVVFINSRSGVVARPMSAQYDLAKHALKAIADTLRGEVNPDGIRVLGAYLGRTASEVQERTHHMEGRPYRPELLLQPKDVASVILNALSLPLTAEVTRHPYKANAQDLSEEISGSSSSPTCEARPSRL